MTWDESKHPRGQPGNAGQFGPGGGSIARHEQPQHPAQEVNRGDAAAEVRRDGAGAGDPSFRRGADDAPDFHEAIARAARDHPLGIAVTVKDESFYADPGTKLFREDGAGAAVTADGDLVSVFRHPNATAKIAPILEEATRHAITGDCYDVGGFLPNLYKRYGMVPVARVKFNIDYAPAGWDAGKLGHPDIVLLARDPKGALGIEFDDYASFRDKVPLFESWDDAAALRDKAVEKIKPKQPVAMARWNPSDHPRDDHGRFVEAHEIEQGRAETPEGYAKQQELDARVTAPQEKRKLDWLLGRHIDRSPGPRPTRYLKGVTADTLYADLDDKVRPTDYLYDGEHLLWTRVDNGKHEHGYVIGDGLADGVIAVKLYGGKEIAISANPHSSVYVAGLQRTFSLKGTDKTVRKHGLRPRAPASPPTASITSPDQERFVLSQAQKIPPEQLGNQRDTQNRYAITAKMGHAGESVGIITFNDDPSRDYIDVSDVFVNKEHRRKGAGTALHRAVMRHALARGKSLMSGSVVSKANKEFWRRLETLGLATVVEAPGPDTWYYGQRLEGMPGTWTMSPQQIERHLSASEKFQRMFFQSLVLQRLTFRLPWDESKHPRDDYGRFVSKGEIVAASQHPEMADELRLRVNDPEQRRRLEVKIAEAEADTKKPATHGRPSAAARAERMRKTLHAPAQHAAEGGTLYGALSYRTTVVPQKPGVWTETGRFIGPGESGATSPGRWDLGFGPPKTPDNPRAGTAAIWTQKAQAAAATFLEETGMSRESWIQHAALISAAFQYPRQSNSPQVGMPAGIPSDPETAGYRYGEGMPDDLRNEGDAAMRVWLDDPSTDNALRLSKAVSGLADWARTQPKDPEWFCLDDTMGHDEANERDCQWKRPREDGQLAVPFIGTGKRGVTWRSPMARDMTGRLRIIGSRFDPIGGTQEGVVVGLIHPESLDHFAHLLADPVKHGPVTFTPNRIESAAADALEKKHEGWDAGIDDVAPPGGVPMKETWNVKPKEIPTKEGAKKQRWTDARAKAEQETHAKAVSIINTLLAGAAQHGELGAKAQYPLPLYRDDLTIAQEIMAKNPPEVVWNEGSGQWETAGGSPLVGTEEDQIVRVGNEFVRIPGVTGWYVGKPVDVTKKPKSRVPAKRRPQVLADPGTYQGTIARVPDQRMIRQARLSAQAVAHGLLTMKRNGFLVDGDWNNPNRHGFVEQALADDPRALHAVPRHERADDPRMPEGWKKKPIMVDLTTRGFMAPRGTGGYYDPSRSKVNIHPLLAMVSAAREAKPRTMLRQRAQQKDVELRTTEKSRRTRGSSNALERYDPNHNETTAASGTFVHEFGHALHFAHDHKRTIPADKDFGKKAAYFGQDESGYGYGMMTDDERGVLADLGTAALSSYGRRNVMETVAETFAKMVHGQPVDRRLFRIYQQMGGFIPAFIRSRSGRERPRRLPASAPRKPKPSRAAGATLPATPEGTA